MWEVLPRGAALRKRSAVLRKRSAVLRKREPVYNIFVDRDTFEIYQVIS